MINDRPIMHPLRWTYAPPIPHNMTSWVNRGFEIKRITGGNPIEVALRVKHPDARLQFRSSRPLASNHKHNNLGACVIEVTTSDRGTWQVKNSDGQWKNLPMIRNQSRSSQIVIRAVCLGPNDRLR